MADTAPHSRYPHLLLGDDGDDRRAVKSRIGTHAQMLSTADTIEIADRTCWLDVDSAMRTKNTDSIADESSAVAPIAWIIRRRRRANGCATILFFREGEDEDEGEVKEGEGEGEGEGRKEPFQDNRGPSV